MQTRPFNTALNDITASAKRYSLIGILGWQDLRQRYRRSAMGPFWITISMGVMIATIGVVFGQIFKSPMREFLPFLSISIILWSFFSSVITEGCNGFIASEGIIKQLPIPLFVHIARIIWRNMLIFAHNIIIFPIVLLAVAKPLHLSAFLSIPGLILCILNLAWVSLLLSVICARYRDFPQIITSILQVVFYLTPIMWMPSLIPSQKFLYLLNFNPVYHLIEIIRMPLLGQFPSYINWLISSAAALFGWIITLTLYGHYKKRIAYWL